MFNLLKSLFIFSKIKSYILCFSLLNLSLYADEIKTITQKAKVYKKNSKTLVYKEFHTITYKNQKIANSKTEYLKPDGKKFAQMISDYSLNTKIPVYSFIDYRDNYSEGIKIIKNKYFMFRKKVSSKEEKKQLDIKDSYFAGQAWHYYIIENMNEIDFDNFSINLILPGRLDTYSFQFKKTSLENNLLKIKLEFKSWFLRLFASHFDLSYDIARKKILSFEGISNIQDDDGQTQNVHVVYD